jgi:hypothetical protein
VARDENPPFVLGGTYFGTEPVDVNVGVNVEGQEYEFECITTTSSVGAGDYRTGRRLKARVVRNMNATAAAAGKLAKLKIDGSTAGVCVGQIDGYCGSVADKGYPVDEFLVGGCRQYDLCYVIIDGLVTVSTAGSGTTTLTVGQVAVPGAAGGLVAQDTTATGAGVFTQIQNAVGKAATAVSANSTAFILDVGANMR